MKINPSQNTVKIDPSQNEVKVTNTVDVTSHTDPYTAYVEVSPSAGGNSCTRITTPDGQRVRLDLVHFTTYSDPGSQAFVRYDVKIGSGVGRIMIQGVPLDGTGTTFPVSNGRAAPADLGLRHGIQQPGRAGRRDLRGLRLHAGEQRSDALRLRRLRRRFK